MAAMFLRKENSTFWDTPGWLTYYIETFHKPEYFDVFLEGEQIVATSDKFFVDPEVLQIITDLDNQLIGLKPVHFSYVLILKFSLLLAVFIR